MKFFFFREDLAVPQLGGRDRFLRRRKEGELEAAA